MPTNQETIQQTACSFSLLDPCFSSFVTFNLASSWKRPRAVKCCCVWMEMESRLCFTFTLSLLFFLRIFDMVVLMNFFFPRIRAQLIIVLRRKKLVQSSVTTQIERTPYGHKPASQLNTTRKINSHINYSHLAQPKRRALSVALSQCSIPWRESSRYCSSTTETSPAMHPHGAVEVRERNYPPLPPPKTPRAEACQPHRVGTSGALPLAVLA